MNFEEWGERFKRNINDSLNSPEGFVEFEKMYRAIQQIKENEFVELVSDFFDGDKDYAEGCWIQFCQAPIGYIYSRSPLEQGEMLYKFAKDKATSEDINERCFSTNKRCYRRFR